MQPSPRRPTRPLAPSFVVAPPTGARIRTRLRLDDRDAQVLRAVGAHLGSLAAPDLAARIRAGSQPGASARHKRALTRDRKRALTTGSSSRWAGTITRVTEDTVGRATSNLADTAAGLRRAATTIQRRLAIPVATRAGRVRGYATQAERWAKQQRLNHLRARLDKLQQQLDAGRPGVVRGGRRLLKARHNLAAAGLTQQQWRARWEAARWFLTADGEAGKAWGNETIRVHPDQEWLELRLPTPLAHLSNTPGRAATYRLGCPVTFSYRTAAWAAQAASGAVGYDIAFDPTKGGSSGRWYLDAAWRLPARPVPSLAELRAHRSLGVDLNAGHLACWVLNPAGDALGDPVTIPLDLDGLPATTRDARVRAAVSHLLRLAAEHGCRSVTVEDLDFADARAAGRETMGRGRRGRRFRRVVSSIPTGRFRDVLAGMAANAGVWVIAVDAAYTSAWGAAYWQEPLNASTRRLVVVSGHHAAAVVIGRRGLGHRARRRGWCAPARPEDRVGRAADSAGRPAAPDATTNAADAASVTASVVVPEPTAQGPGGPGGQRAGPPQPRHTHRDSGGL